jgi:hypothetical protein
MELGGPTEEEQAYLASLQHSSEAEGGYAIEQGPSCRRSDTA